MSAAGEAMSLVRHVESAVALDRPVGEVLDLADTAIGTAAESHDAVALERLAVVLDAAAAARDDGRGLAIAAERARIAAAAIVPPATAAPAPAPAPLPAQAFPRPTIPLLEPDAETAAASPVVRYAGWWQRAFAILVDWVALGTAVAFVPTDASDGVWAVALLVLPLAYFTGMHAYNRGQTIGKALFGIAVRTYAGSGVGLGGALVRALVQGVLWVTVVGGLVDVLVPLGDDRRRALHDRAAQTVVVRVR
jgi:uncharacterized RDD family membrane protein YckC